MTFNTLILMNSFCDDSTVFGCSLKIFLILEYVKDLQDNLATILLIYSLSAASGRPMVGRTFIITLVSGMTFGFMFAYIVLSTSSYHISDMVMFPERYFFLDYFLQLFPASADSHQLFHSQFQLSTPFKFISLINSA